VLLCLVLLLVWFSGDSVKRAAATSGVIAGIWPALNFLVWVSGFGFTLSSC